MKKIILVLIIFATLFFVIGKTMAAVANSETLSSSSITNPIPTSTPTVVRCIVLKKLKYPVNSGKVIEPVIPKDLEQFKERVYYANSIVKKKITGFTVCFFLTLNDSVKFEKVCKKNKIKIVTK